MATWHELDQKWEPDKDEEEANLALMASTSLDIESDLGSRSDSKEEEEVFSKLSHTHLIILIQDLMEHCQEKSKHIKILKNNFEQKTNELKSLQNKFYDLEKKIKLKMCLINPLVSMKWLYKSFFIFGFNGTKLASMI